MTTPELNWLFASALFSLCIGCGAATTGTTGALKPTHFDAPGAASTLYESQPPAGTAVGGPHAERLGAGIGQRKGLSADPRLRELAGWALSKLDDQGAPPPHPVIDLWAHHLGLPEPAPHLIVLGQSDPSTLAERVDQELTRALANHRYTHYGAASGDIDGTVLVVIALSWRWADIEAVPRRIEKGAELKLSGELDPELSAPELVVTFPDGSDLRGPRQKGRRFEVRVPTDQQGEYRVELLAHSKLGSTVVANFPVFVGVEPTTSITVEGSAAEGGLTPEQLAARLLELTNKERKRAGLHPLELHQGLSKVALGHSQDMHAHGFVGHTSPTTGSAAQRVERAGLRTPVVLENIGRGYSTAEVHGGLMDSPGHRANILNPRVSHVGIGSVITTEDERSVYLVTLVYSQFAKIIDTGNAPAELLSRINAERERRGAPPLELDETLSAHCQQAAERFFSRQAPAREPLLQRLSQESAKAGLPYRRLGAMLTVVASLEDAAGIDSLLERSIAGLGLGIAQGTRSDTMEDAIAVVAIVAY
ncbi:MAG: CAP domain-containing protein [Myxococcales bacterium]|nr:CAP domain-containing protein [Myxococcales bacterium]